MTHARARIWERTKKTRNELILRESLGTLCAKTKVSSKLLALSEDDFLMDCRMRLLEIYGKEQEQQQEARKMLCRLKHVLADLDAKTASALLWASEMLDLPHRPTTKEEARQMVDALGAQLRRARRPVPFRVRHLS